MAKISFKETDINQYEVTCSCGNVYDYCAYHNYPEECPRCGNDVETMFRIWEAERKAEEKYYNE